MKDQQLLIRSILFCLFDLNLYILVNNFSVMSGGIFGSS